MIDQKEKKQLQEKIQSRCSLTKGDVAAVLAELQNFTNQFLCRSWYISLLNRHENFR